MLVLPAATAARNKRTVRLTLDQAAAAPDAGLAAPKSTLGGAWGAWGRGAGDEAGHLTPPPRVSTIAPLNNKSNKNMFLKLRENYTNSL